MLGAFGEGFVETIKEFIVTVKTLVPKSWSGLMEDIGRIVAIIFLIILAGIGLFVLVFVAMCFY